VRTNIKMTNFVVKRTSEKHAGFLIYYSPALLEAKLCLAGRENN
jgi:hypothetical protein